MPNTQHGFAQREMNRCGWSEGKGLGKSENGMKNAIKVKLKNNTGGLGHDEGTQFTFHWWDHIFNKAANSFKVSEGEEGALIEKCEGKKITPVLISNKKPLSSKYANASLLYGTFVKAGTYNADTKELSDSLTENDSSDESSDEENEKLSLNDTLEKTFKKTGLTGHKAARHGFNLCGKLQRLENQENSQLPSSVVNAQTSNKNSQNNIPHNENNHKISTDGSNSASIENLPKESNIQVPDDFIKKKKKKRKKELEKEIEQTKEVVSIFNNRKEVKDKKRKCPDMMSELGNGNNIEIVSDEVPVRKKKKKKDRDAPLIGEETALSKDENSTCLSNDVDNVIMEVPKKTIKSKDEDLCKNQAKKKKKKKKKDRIE